ncbi:cytochrome c oxidase subunit 3 [Tenacibaculum finnmarkense genomovar finnmarkense]|uniref:Cytochrome oxidase subunit III n=2 Tax=Tenacibaculum finnmarkense TaxID=2781243 RepID=A0A2I2M974_9FLAO|nr:cytochrome c oxidase subunit 3 [Tenacibaculum finnmarkense]MBE7644902.1 heme-copper oxidase subunit III [Tenacibaculum finnmarkense genomovar ulcerans]MBE7652118.1 heme-copper oxidase subunit III [Tenacibaculum finnmarkense genomovar finnmarkense]MBE7659654.1 heme-copper oxidase subunit III [Tenacibaculum finnmarkense genomovar finnmarkense]MBE7691855.1 heme-copper oxidase subunit III [Tenacibaculum finnmarkense genomovar finnmarkense]MBE7694167.1 heme-copper oxidase subunit III [Tenacibacu
MSAQTLQEELRAGKRKSAKPMLWISMISMAMFFAGLTSAYVVSQKRDDWVTFDLPQAFYISTVLIILSSITLIISQLLLKKDNLKASLLFLLATLVLGIGFVWFQYVGFNELRAVGLFFTGPESTVSTSFVLGITFMHILHLLAGIIVLLVVIYNHFKKKYSSADTLGFELGGIFWHFVDILWIYLFFFFYFIR